MAPDTPAWTFHRKPLFGEEHQFFFLSKIVLNHIMSIHFSHWGLIFRCWSVAPCIRYADIQVKCFMACCLVIDSQVSFWNSSSLIEITVILWSRVCSTCEELCTRSAHLRVFGNCCRSISYHTYPTAANHDITMTNESATRLNVI